MANVSRPHGFRPVMQRDGSPWNGRVVEMYFAAGDATAVGIGDPITMDASASSSDGTPGATRFLFGTASLSTVYGIVVGFRANPSDLNTTGLYRAAATARYALVCPVQDVIFEVQADGANQTSVAATIGLFGSMTTDQTVSTTTGLSTVQLDMSTVAATTTLALQVVGGVRREDNDLTLTNAKWLVQFTTPQLSQLGVAASAA